MERTMLFPLTGNGTLRNFPLAVFPEVAGSSLVHLACEDLEMKRKGSNPERGFGSAHHRSEEWEDDPVGRMYDDDEEEEAFEGDDEEEFEDDEEEDDDLDEDDDYDEEEEDEEEEDDF
jgi:hypothetical protein